MTATSTVHVTDDVSMTMSRSCPVSEKIAVGVNVHVVLTGADGTVKFDEWGGNLLTDHGDNWIAARIYDDSQNIVTGMRVGTGTTAAAKNGAGAALVTYVSGGYAALDAVASDATKGAGLGWRATFVATFAAGVGTDGALGEVVLTDETPLTDTAGVEGDTVARYVPSTTIQKQSLDTLTVTWNVDILGA